ncbi:arginine-fifty homeobox [Octodon degus]|uniref:Arginine-fifty homeobox n=1 Tax=Octodon degus TaxID=10160 RepID=A0A6P6DDI0_OCTDE|nr:arginine-fifty homeobox [Octodon degus]
MNTCVGSGGGESSYLTTAATRMKPRKRTSFTHKQQKALKALFSQTRYPEKKVLKALAERFTLCEKSVKAWFRNRRFKMKQQQKQEEPRRQDEEPHSPLSYESIGSSNSSEDVDVPEGPTVDFQVQELQLERLEPSVPTVYSNIYDITQITALYSFLDEGQAASCSFSCLYQYLSPAGSRLARQSVSPCTFCGPLVGPSTGQSYTPSVMSQGSTDQSLRHPDSPEPFQ